MRTPGHDEELALGFCLSEGMPATARACRRPRGQHGRGGCARLRPERAAAELLHLVLVRRLRKGRARGGRGRGAAGRERRSVAAALVQALPERLRAGQAAFEATGGLHATGLFDAGGELLCLREDVGRHNAMDKVVGRAFPDGRLPLSPRVLCVSGRLSFELVQKAVVAGCPVWSPSARRRRSPSTLSNTVPASYCSRSTASDDGEPTATRTGQPATAAFCTSSNESRPLTQSTCRTAAAGGLERPGRSPCPSRVAADVLARRRSSPRREESRGVQPARRSEGRLGRASVSGSDTTSRRGPSAGSRPRGASTATASSAPLPQTPHDDDV